MNLPQIVFQTSSRWFVVNKPPGWALAARASQSQPSIERYLNPIIGAEKLYFPMEFDTRIRALAIVCTDRGVQAQFEKFKQLGLIQSTYRIGLDCPCRGIVNSTPPVGMRITCKDPEIPEAIVELDQPSTVLKLRAAVSGRLRDYDINLFKLVFPDPLNPKGSENLVIEAP